MKEHKYEVIKDSDWIELRRAEGWYDYSHQLKNNGIGIAILGFSKNDDGTYKFVGRYENCPPHFNGIKLTSLTGMWEEGNTMRQMAVKEMKEESGITITENDLIPLGSVRPSKGSDTTISLYGVDVTGKEIGRARGDGTKGEQDSYCKWIKISDIITSKDTLMPTMLLKLMAMGYIEN